MGFYPLLWETQCEHDHTRHCWLDLYGYKLDREVDALNDPAAYLTAKKGWCSEREKIDLQEPCKFDFQLVWRIFIFLLCLTNFHKPLASGHKIKF